MLLASRICSQTLARSGHFARSLASKKGPSTAARSGLISLRQQRDYSEQKSPTNTNEAPNTIKHVWFTPEMGDVKVDIGTLSPSNLTERDYVEISGNHNLYLGVRDEPDIGLYPAFRVEPNWPPSTKGFFYFHEAPEGVSKIASSLRFRVTGSADPKSFDAGYDLPYMGLPFNVPLVYSARPAVRHLLLRDQVLTGKMFKTMHTMQCLRDNLPLPMSVALRYHPHRTPLIYSKRQPFLFNFARPRSQAWLIAGPLDRPTITSWQFEVPSVYLREGEREKLDGVSHENFAKAVPLYTGSAIVQFQDGDPAKLKILKLFDLHQKYDLETDIPKPTEGGYISTCALRSRAMRPRNIVSIFRQQVWEALPDLPLGPEYAHLVPQSQLATATNEADETQREAGMQTETETIVKEDEETSKVD